MTYWLLTMECSWYLLTYIFEEKKRKKLFTLLKREYLGNYWSYNAEILKEHRKAAKFSNKKNWKICHDIF